MDRCSTAVLPHKVPYRTFPLISSSNAMCTPRAQSPSVRVLFSLASKLTRRDSDVLISSIRTSTTPRRCIKSCSSVHLSNISENGNSGKVGRERPGNTMSPDCVPFVPRGHCRRPAFSYLFFLGNCESVHGRVLGNTPRTWCLTKCVSGKTLVGHQDGAHIGR